MSNTFVAASTHNVEPSFNIHSCTVRAAAIGIRPPSLRNGKDTSRPPIHPLLVSLLVAPPLIFCVLALLLSPPSLALLRRIAPSRASRRLRSSVHFFPSFPSSRNGRRQQQTEQMPGGRTRQLGKEYHHQPSEARHEEGEHDWKGGRGTAVRCAAAALPLLALTTAVRCCAAVLSAPLRSVSRLPRWLRRSAFWLRSSNTAT